MMVTILSVLVSAALLVVGSLQRRSRSLSIDVALFTIAALTVAISTASPVPWVRFCYILLGLMIAAGAARNLIRRRAHDTTRSV